MQTIQDPIEQTFSGPPSIPIVDGLPLAVAFGHVTPLGAAVKNSEHAVEHGAMVLPLATGLLRREQWFDALERFVGQLIPPTTIGVRLVSMLLLAFRSHEIGLLAEDQSRHFSQKRNHASA